MKLSPVLMPNDAAAILEQEIAFLDRLQNAPTPEDREEALAALRAWVVGTAAALRQADPRGQTRPVPAPTPPPPSQDASGAPLASKKPCGCPESGKPGSGAEGLSQGGGLREVGQALGRLALKRLGWDDDVRFK